MRELLNWASRDFTVSTLAGLLVAVGTIILALFTWRLASATAKSVREARAERALTEQALRASNRIAASADEQLVVSREQVKGVKDQADAATHALQTAARPVLIDVPLQRFATRDFLYKMEFADGLTVEIRDLGEVVVPREAARGYAYCSVPLRNVGTGPALIRGNRIVAGLSEYSWNGAISDPVVPAGELTRLTFTVPMDRGELNSITTGLLNGQPPPEIEVRYTDIDEFQDLRTRLHLNWTGMQWYVRQVFFFRGDDGEPFASTGPRTV
jgi:hypothetical protein